MVGLERQQPRRPALRQLQHLLLLLLLHRLLLKYKQTCSV
jgi:hypothetical protein